MKNKRKKRNNVALRKEEVKWNSPEKNTLERIHTLACGKTFLLMVLLRETKKLYAFSGGYYY